MRRRDVMAMSVGTLVAGAFGVRVFGQALSATSAAEDEALAHRYDRERRFVATRFGRIAYVERGTGPVALFLHGFPLSSFQWRGVIEPLSEERRCIAPDAMGLGYTEVVPGQSLTPGAQADMLIALLESLAIDRVDLIANDSGGAIAQLFLSRHPERVRTLLLTNCDVEIDSPPAALLPFIKLARAGLYPEHCTRALAQGQGTGALADGPRRNVLHRSRVSDRRRDRAVPPPGRCVRGAQGACQPLSRRSRDECP